MLNVSKRPYYDDELRKLLSEAEENFEYDLQLLNENIEKVDENQTAVTLNYQVENTFHDEL